MLQTLVVVVGIALADSVNPATVGPAVLFAMAERPARRVAEFAAGALLVNFVGGALLVLGPGQWVLSLFPKPGAHAKHLIELVAGCVLVLAAVAVWLLRRRLADGRLPSSAAGSRGAFGTGATLMLVELPTAFPYFAAIAAIVALDGSVAESLVLVAIFNLVFLAPVLAIAVLVHHSHSVRSLLEPLARWLARFWPLVFVVLLGLVGATLIGIGAANL